MAAPLAKWKEKGIDVAIWPTNNGGYSTTITKTYKDKKTGEYKKTNSFFKSDIENLQIILAKAIKWLEEHDTREEARELVSEGSSSVPSAQAFDDTDIPF